MRHYVNMKMKNVLETNVNWILSNLKTHSTSYIRKNCEQEGGINVSEEEWIIMWRFHWKGTSNGGNVTGRT